MRKVDDKRVHKALTALAIGGPAGSDAQMMSLLESIDVGEGRANGGRRRARRLSRSSIAEPIGDGQGLASGLCWVDG